MAVWQSTSSKSQVRSANNFSKGLNTQVSPFFVDENTIVSGYGWDFDQFPAIKTRAGMTKYGGIYDAVPALMTTYEDYLIRAFNGKIQLNRPVFNQTWTDVTGTYSGGIWSATNFDISGQALILVDTSSGGYYFKVSSSPQIMAIPQMPPGRHITSDNLRVYVANTNQHPDYIYYSGFQNALDFTSAGNSGFVQFYTPTGGAITGIYSYSGSVWVFKKDAYAILYHTGDSTLAYRLVPMSDTIGCASAKTIAEVGSYIVFMSSDDVYIGSGDSVSSIGGPIRSFIKSINESVIDNAFAFVKGKRYYLYIPSSSSTFAALCFVYDLEYGCWLPHTASAPGFAVATTLGKYPYTTDILGQSYRLFDGTTDYGTAIPWSIQSRPFDEGAKEAEKELWEMHILGRFAAGSTMTVQVSPRDDLTEWYPIEYDPLGTNAATQNKNLIVPLDTMPLCNYYSYRLSGTGDVTIQEVQRYSRIQPVQY